MPSVKQFGASEVEKVNLTIANQNKIKQMYSDLSKSAQKQAKKINGSQMTSDRLRKQYLDDYVGRLGKEVDALTVAIEKQTKSTMTEIASSVVKANNEFMQTVGMSIDGAFSHVPTTVVNRLITGQVYKDNWDFSSHLWKDMSKVKTDMYDVVARGIAGQKATYDIAKDLETYLNPNARKSWDWSKVYPGTNKVVDYSAQRLARTLSQHTYQIAMREVVKNNPFIERIEWHSAGIHGRTCALCSSRDGEMYPKNDVPLDHPNGMCYYIVVLEKPLADIADEIGKWANGESNPALDAYYKDAVSQQNNPKSLAAVKAQSRKVNVGKVVKVTAPRTIPGPVQKVVGPSSLPRKTFDKTIVDDLLDTQSASLSPKVQYIESLKTQSDKWSASLTQTEKQAIFNYTHKWDQQINQYKRGIAKTISEEAAQYSKEVSTALSKATLSKDTGLVRTTDVKALLNMTNNLSTAKKTTGGMKGWLGSNYQSLVGQVTEDKAFMSTSARQGGGLFKTKAGSVNFKILAPKGTQGMYIAPESRFFYEHEVLLQEGQRMIIREVVPPQGKVKDWTIYAEILVK